MNEKRKILAGGFCILMLGFAGINGFSYEEEAESSAVEDTVKEASEAWEPVQNFIKEQVLLLCAPVFSFGVQEHAREYENLFEEALLSEIPFFSYMYENGGQELPVQDDTTWQYLLASDEVAAGDEIYTEDNTEKSIEDVEKTAEGQEELNLDTAFEMENENARAMQEGQENVQEEVAATEFMPHERQITYNPADYQEFSKLFETFYAMDSNTMVGRDELNVETLMGADVTIDKTAAGPQILIYHTHSQETFADSVPGDKSTSIVGAGDKLTKLLTETYGYSVLHHTGEYDVGDRDNAYSRSLPALEQILAENPSIQVVIDLHRDGVAEDRKLAVDLDGRPTAQFMFFNGLSRTKNTGDIDYLYNPYQADNLALSFQMQLAVDEYYPGLARRIYLNGYRYNMHLRPSLLIELGAQTNTVEEIMNAIDPLAHVLDLVFSGKNAH